MTATLLGFLPFIICLLQFQGKCSIVKRNNNNKNKENKPNPTLPSLLLLWKPKTHLIFLRPRDNLKPSAASTTFVSIHVPAEWPEVKDSLPHCSLYCCPGSQMDCWFVHPLCHRETSVEYQQLWAAQEANRKIMKCVDLMVRGFKTETSWLGLIH